MFIDGLDELKFGFKDSKKSDNQKITKPQKTFTPKLDQSRDKADRIAQIIAEAEEFIKDGDLDSKKSLPKAKL